MTGEELRSRADIIAENSVLKLVGRLGMAFVAPVFLVSMTWLGTTIWELNTNQANIAGKIELLFQRIEQATDDSYRGTDAQRDFKLRDQKDDEHDRRLDRLDTRIRDIETITRGPTP